MLAAAAVPCFCWSDEAEPPVIEPCTVAFAAASTEADVVVVVVAGGNGSDVVMVAGSWPIRCRFLPFP
jgi:hypothetical protein